MDERAFFVGSLADFLKAAGINGHAERGDALTPHAAMSLTKALVAEAVDKVIMHGDKHVGCALFGAHGAGEIMASFTCTQDGASETIHYVPRDDENGPTHKLIVTLRRVPLVPDSEESVSADDVERAIERVTEALAIAVSASNVITTPLLANLPKEMGEQLANEMETSLLVLRCLKRMHAMMDSPAN